MGEIDSEGTRRSRRRLGLLTVGAIGVVFGDIGTSPLYAFTQIFSGAHTIPVVEARVLGALSMVFWTLTLVVSVKYVVIVMRADNQGEGGIMVLASLASSAVKRHRASAGLMLLGLIGAALFYGDGLITPAVSVLSAVEGIGVAAPSLDRLVIPIALVILFLFFAVQRFGTGRVGRVFGPIMIVWFLSIAILGLASVIKTPGVLRSINPYYAFTFFSDEPGLAFLALGAIVLCVTGAEALYADMGQFGRSPIRLSWFAIVAPALYLNYLGQGALVLRDPSAIANSFFLLVPHSLQIPMVIFATAATVIASQAVVSGAFSMTQQAIRLGYLPRMTVRHTSANEGGQVYVPAVNWMLMIAVLGLILGFQDSSRLASAYGIAVTGTFVITGVLVAILARNKWGVSLWIVIPAAAVSLVIDGAFFLSNLTKFMHGGWFPLVIAVIIVAMLSTWQWGRKRLASRLESLKTSAQDLPAYLDAQHVVRTPGVAIYPTVEEGIPIALVQRIALVHAVNEVTVVLHLVTADTPYVDDAKRVETISGAVIDVTASYGYMERPDILDVVRRVSLVHPEVDPDTCTFIFHSMNVETVESNPIKRIPTEVFTIMLRNATDPQHYFGLPADRVLEFGRLIQF